MTGKCVVCGKPTGFKVNMESPTAKFTVRMCKACYGSITAKQRVLHN